MTAAQKKLLTRLSAPGCDVNQVARVAMTRDKRGAKTYLALLRLGMLQIAPDGGLEVSELGRASAPRLAP